MNTEQLIRWYEEHKTTWVDQRQNILASMQISGTDDDCVVTLSGSFGPVVGAELSDDMLALAAFSKRIRFDCKDVTAFDENTWKKLVDLAQICDDKKCALILMHLPEQVTKIGRRHLDYFTME